MSKIYRTATFLIAALLAVCVGSTSQAARVDFYLTNNVVTNTWELAASTDSPGGLAAFIVNLINIGSGESVAPRSAYQGIAIKGFKIGNLSLPIPVNVGSYKEAEAFAGQYPDIDNLVYGIGYEPVPDADFGVTAPLSMVGSAATIPVVLYHGTFDPSRGLPGYHAIQSHSANVFVSRPPPGGYTNPVQVSDVTFSAETISFNLLTVPEPTGVMLGAMGVLFFAVARRRVAASSPRSAALA